MNKKMFLLLLVSMAGSQVVMGSEISSSSDDYENELNYNVYCIENIGDTVDKDELKELLKKSTENLYISYKTYRNLELELNNDYINIDCDDNNDVFITKSTAKKGAAIVVGGVAVTGIVYALLRYLEFGYCSNIQNSYQD